MRAAIVASLFAVASGHGSLIIPTSRNAFDRAVPGFAFDGGSLETPCTCADKGTGCAQGIPAVRISVEANHQPLRALKPIALSYPINRPIPSNQSSLPIRQSINRTTHPDPPSPRSTSARLGWGRSARAAAMSTSVLRGGAVSRACGGARAARSAALTA